MNSNVTKPSMGVLNLHNGEKRFRLSRYSPSDEAGFFIMHYWIVSWDLTGQPPYTQDVVPNPCVNLVIEKNKTAIYAPAKNKYSYCLEGKGSVFGVKFKPGGFYPFMRQSVTGLLLDRSAVGDMFDTDAERLESLMLNQTDEQKMIELAERMIKPKLPAYDENVVIVNRIIDQIVQEREITRVDHICEQMDISKRTLQRLFNLYVGVTPKWVIQLYRLQNAAEALERDPCSVDLLKLSAELGYHDQSHFIKDFKAFIGLTPNEYVKQNMEIEMRGSK